MSLASFATELFHVNAPGGFGLVERSGLITASKFSFFLPQGTSLRIFPSKDQGEKNGKLLNGSIG